MVAKALKFQPIGDDLSFVTSMVHASNLLDLAASYADAVKDHESLTQIAAVYMEIGSRLIQVVEDDDDEEDTDDEDEAKPVGFRPNTPIVVEPQKVEEEVLDEQDS